MQIESRKARQKILEAYDAVGDVRVFTGHGKGASSACALCGSFMGDPHKTDESGQPCPVGIASAALNSLVPPFFDRDKWLAEATRE